jgi:hypothetical protein
MSILNIEYCFISEHWVLLCMFHSNTIEMKRPLQYLVIATLFLSNFFPVLAQTNDGKIPFQGVLYEAGEPVTATKQMIFSIASVSWTETHSVSVVNGLYSVVLGEITPFPENLFETSNTASLGINVAGSALPPVEIHAPFLNEAIVARNMPKSTSIRNAANDRDLINLQHHGQEGNAGEIILKGSDDSNRIRISMNEIIDQGGSVVDEYGSITFGDWGSENYTSALNGGRLIFKSTIGNSLLDYYARGSQLDQGKVAGELWLNSDDSQNIRLSSKFWEENGLNLPYISMKGSITESNTNPNLVWMDVSQDTNTATEWGALNLNSTADNSGIRMYGDFNGIDGNGTRAHLAIDGANDNHVWMWGDGTIDATGSINLNGPNGEHFGINYNGFTGDVKSKSFVLENDNNQKIGNMSSIGESGQLNIGTFIDGDERVGGGVSLGGKFWEQNPANGYIHLRGPVNEAHYFYAKLKFTLESQDDGNGNQNADFKMYSPQLDENNKAKAVLNMYSKSDDQVNWASEIQGFGSSTLNFTLGAKTWETNGADLPYIALHGMGNDMVLTEVSQDTNTGAEWGALNLNSTAGNSGIRMYGDFNSIDQGGSRAHLAVDGAGDNHVWMWGDGTISATGDISASGDIRAGGGAITLNGNGHISASTIDATNTSDRRFKKNIKPIEGALAKSMRINGNSYQWNKLAEKEKSLQENKNKIGVIAQEVEKLFPELVETDKKGYKSVDYAGLTAVLLEAVKELSAKVTTLESENSDLIASMKRLSQLESKINLIEKLLINKPVDTSKSTALK